MDLSDNNDYYFVSACNERQHYSREAIDLGRTTGIIAGIAMLAIFLYAIIAL
jgi:hypothetical protein